MRVEAAVIASSSTGMFMATQYHESLGVVKSRNAHQSINIV